MLFRKINRLNGDSNQYRLNPQIKAYSLRDVGFRTSGSGNFKLKQSLNVNYGPKLKIVISKNLKLFKMDITDEKGFRKINLFDHRHQQGVHQLRYVISNLILRKILQRVN